MIIQFIDVRRYAMVRRINEWKDCDFFTCFDIPISMKLDVTEIMIDKGYTLIADYRDEVVFEKVINGKKYKVSFEPNKYINNVRNEKLFNKILALPE